MLKTRQHCLARIGSLPQFDDRNTGRICYSESDKALMCDRCESESNRPDVKLAGEAADICRRQLYRATIGAVYSPNQRD